MKKARILGAVLAGVMALAAAPQIVKPFDVVISAASDKLAAPANIKASNVKQTSIKLTWDKVKGADKYRVYKYDTATKTFKTYKTVSTTSCTVKNLEAGTSYKFRVAALVETSSGKYSVQTKSKTVTCKTTASSKASTGLIAMPKYGIKGKEAVKQLGLKNAQFMERETKGVTIGVYMGNIEIGSSKSKSNIGMVMVDSNDVCFGAMVAYDDSVATFKDTYAALKKANGKPQMDLSMMGMEMYMWMDETTMEITAVMGMDQGGQSFTTYFGANYTYMPDDLKEAVQDGDITTLFT